MTPVILLNTRQRPTGPWTVIRFGSVLVMWSIALIALPRCTSGQTDAEADLHQEVVDFVISLPGGGKISRNGATGIPGNKLLLREEFRVPRPSQIVLPAGTVIEQVGGIGWDNLHFIGPDQKQLVYSAATFSGCTLSPPIDWSTIKVEVPPPSESVQRILNQLKRPGADVHTLLTLLQTSGPLTPFDARRVLTEYARVIQPETTADEIKARYVAFRRDIHSISIKAITEYESRDSTLKELRRPKTRFNLFKMQHEKLIAETKSIEAGSDEWRLFRYVFTGESEIEYVEMPGLQRATRQPFGGRSRYYEEDHLFRTSMILDPALDLGTDMDDSSLNNTDFLVLRAVQRKGVSVIPCITLNFRMLFLDPARGHALVADENRYRFDESIGRLVLADEQYVMDLVDHQDHGSGLWLPGEVNAVWREGEKEILRRRTRYSEVTVNREIPSAEFENSIPAGVLIVDRITGRAERVADSELPIQPSPSAKSKPGSRWWLLWLNVVVLIFVGTAHLTQRRRR